MSARFVSELSRTHTCGELRGEHQGKEVVLMGWVDTRRDHGGLVFVDLRDRYGLVQVVLNPNDDNSETNAQIAKDLRNEFVIAVQGKVRLRPEGMSNNKMHTGDVEVEVTRCEILSEAKTPPFQIGDPKVSESLRLKYRYLDLRNPQLQDHLITRHKTVQAVRKHLSEQDFVEIETPILYKSTPEGARDYLVPSRVNPGNFYALPQSPQTLKQLLMVSGFDRYFQIARCFRDEDLRADRQPEFSQIDIEMSFVDEPDLRKLTEGIARKVWKEIKGKEITEFPILTYDEAMNRFGCDKPDLRLPWELVDLGEQVRECGFKVFEDVVGRGGVVKALAVPGIGEYSRSQFDKLTDKAKQMGAKGLVWIKADANGDLTSPVAKFFDSTKFQELYFKAGGVAKGGVLIVADEFKTACAALSTLRLHLGHTLGVTDYSRDSFLWVTEFPLLEYDSNEKRWVACHHPFTAPKDDDLETLLSGAEVDFAKIRAKAYDFICNGNELAGGSIRIHNPKVQSAIFKALGLSPEETKHKFGFFIEALEYGTPPHGGIAFGMDRLSMIISGTDAIRDVIAFPKTAKATDLMAEAPNSVGTEQLIELGLRLAPAVKKAWKTTTTSHLSHLEISKTSDKCIERHG